MDWISVRLAGHPAALTRKNDSGATYNLRVCESSQTS